MIIGDNRKAVIENIKLCAESGEFHNKVELNDPVLTAEQSKKITENYIENRKQPAFRAKTALGVTLAKSAAKIVNKNTVITGLEKIPENLGGCLGSFFLRTANLRSPYRGRSSGWAEG